ncbi:MAG: zf-HC2 domain-containing protein [Deltaproteobacteria bacterium]|nr:zf-HC2 domain-containing protein [Deltaproteobacteria bacterium]
MECGKVLQVLQEEIDGRLPPSESAGVRGHLESCASCAAEAAAYRRVGVLLRAWTGAREAENAPRLDAMWTRVRAGIDERKERGRFASMARKWFWLPAAAALAGLALLFYSSGVSRPPFNPTSFDVAVENLESDTATVALVDRGEDLPRVIWIFENDKT